MSQRSGKVYYYFDLGGKPRKELPLGSDYVLAVQKWAELQQSNIPENAVVTFKMVWDQYLKEVLFDKPLGTQKDCLKSISRC